ncbi:hypothetical protein D8674_021129 [Pyrus ussuriensis x Pyrus communis]|uniref:Uncharacterized protein n=1 Tax=Pyrus ussuriensis x Pyrus communis TaxID=2448454 RepID=A0A5N5HMU2_9ROSA|nr:hypothetical protein D8674_021129 [Pyrus ussuriensis x Pyrus communis]
MNPRSRAIAKAKAKAKAKSKSKSLAGPGSGSGQEKIPGQRTKLGDGPPSQLKNEKAVEENLAKLQLDEGNTTTPKSKPEEKKMSRAFTAEKPFRFQFKHPCEVCNVFGHWSDLCPYLKRIPDNVTEVGKGYIILDGRGLRYADMMFCLLCGKFRDHEDEDCPDLSKFIAEGHPLLNLVPRSP